MKKCPYCRAEIQENARFCLYCMKSLDEKQPVSSPQKRKPFLFIGAAAVLVVLILILSCCVGAGSDGETPPQKEQGSMTPDEAVMQQASPSENNFSDAPEETMQPPASQTDTEPQIPAQPQQTDPATPQTPTQPQQTDPVKPQTPTQPQQTDPVKPQLPTQTEPSQPAISQKPTQPIPTQPETSEPPTEIPVTAPAQCTHRYQVTKMSAPACTADGSNTYTCDLCGDSYRQTIPATGHSFQAATCLLPQTCTICGATGTAALGHSYQNENCSRCGKADPSAPRNIYEYREARAGDQLTAGTWNPETDIVITAVKQIAADGVYEIPSYIDGKRVVAIRPLAFSDTDARRITLGENIIYVAENAFSGCYNINALYIRSDYLYLSRSAFIPASSRNCTVKIYCSDRCTVKDALKGECCLKDIVRVYGGEYHEWNG